MWYCNFVMEIHECFNCIAIESAVCDWTIAFGNINIHSAWWGNHGILPILPIVRDHAGNDQACMQKNQSWYCIRQITLVYRQRKMSHSSTDITHTISTETLSVCLSMPRYSLFDIHVTDKFHPTLNMSWYNLLQIIHMSTYTHGSRGMW